MSPRRRPLLLPPHHAQTRAPSTHPPGAPLHLRDPTPRRPLRHPAIHRRSPLPHRLQRHRPPPCRPPTLRPPDRQPQSSPGRHAPQRETRTRRDRRRDNHPPRTRRPRTPRRSRQSHATQKHRRPPARTHDEGTQHRRRAEVWRTRSSTGDDTRDSGSRSACNLAVKSLRATATQAA